MLKALMQAPAVYAQEEIQDAARCIDEAASFWKETLTSAEILDAIQRAEGSLHAAARYLDMAKAKAKHIKKDAYKRVISRDVACRYLKRFGGHTFKRPNGYGDYFVFLVDHEGETRGEYNWPEC